MKPLYFENHTSLLYSRLRGGNVARYHTNPEVGNGQNVADHTWKACVILHTLWPEISKDALLHMIYHDAPEGKLGDLPAPTKWNYPALAKEYAIAEREYERTLGIHIPLDDMETARCKMADLLELIMHCARQMIMGNLFAENVYKNGVNYMRKHFSENPDYAVVETVLDQIDLSVRQKTPLHAYL